MFKNSSLLEEYLLGEPTTNSTSAAPPSFKICPVTLHHIHRKILKWKNIERTPEEILKKVADELELPVKSVNHFLTQSGTSCAILLNFNEKYANLAFQNYDEIIEMMGENKTEFSTSQKINLSNYTLAELHALIIIDCKINPIFLDIELAKFNTNLAALSTKSIPEAEIEFGNRYYQVADQIHPQHPIHPHMVYLKNGTTISVEGGPNKIKPKQTPTTPQNRFEFFTNNPHRKNPEQPNNVQMRNEFARKK